MTDEPSGDDATVEESDDAERADEDGRGETVTYDERSEHRPDGDGETERALPAVDEPGAEETVAPAGSTSSDEVNLEPVSDRDPERSDDDTTREPLGDLAAAVGRRREESADVDDLFEREDVTQVDGDAVWERIERDEPGPDLENLEEREIREIAKRSYCHQCEHFEDPPDVACTNEGTEILEMPSLETFRVADCPVVLEEEDLEAGTGREDRS